MSPTIRTGNLEYDTFVNSLEQNIKDDELIKENYKYLSLQETSGDFINIFQIFESSKEHVFSGRDSSYPKHYKTLTSELFYSTKSHRSTFATDDQLYALEGIVLLGNIRHTGEIPVYRFKAVAKETHAQQFEQDFETITKVLKSVDGSITCKSFHCAYKTANKYSLRRFNIEVKEANMFLLTVKSSKVPKRGAKVSPQSSPKDFKCFECIGFEYGQTKEALDKALKAVKEFSFDEDDTHESYLFIDISVAPYHRDLFYKAYKELEKGPEACRVFAALEKGFVPQAAGIQRELTPTQRMRRRTEAIPIHTEEREKCIIS